MILTIKRIVAQSNNFTLYSIVPIIAFGVFFSMASTALALDLDYTITIDNPDSHQAKVTMKASNINQNLFKIWEIASPNGYGGINIISFQAKDIDGNLLPVKHTLGDGCKGENDIWDIDTTGVSSIEFNYVIETTNLTCDNQGYWGYINDKFAVLIGAYIFLFPVVEMSSIESVKVRCNVPSGWKIITPWPQTDGVYDPYSSYKSHFMQLFGYSIWCFGEFDTHSKRINTDEVTIAAYKYWQDGKKKNLVNKVFQFYSYLTSAWGSGINKPWVIVFNPPADDGKSINGGGSSLCGVFTVEDNNEFGWYDFVWAILSSRWINHQWGFSGNGNCIWFKAGGSSFYAIKAMLRKYNEPASPVLNSFYNNYLDYYISPNKDFPIVLLDLIDHPPYEHYMPLIKGTLAVFLTAKELYIRTNGRVKIDDLSRSLFRKYWGTGPRITVEDFKKEIELLTGSDFTEFFNDYFYGTKVYPIDWAFEDDDGDELSNGDEIFWDTNPNKSDTDGDGYSDLVEIKARTDPNNRRSCPGDCPPTPMPWVPMLLLK